MKTQILYITNGFNELEMNPDRADVIIPFTRIYLSAVKWSKSKHLRA